MLWIRKNLGCSVFMSAFSNMSWTWLCYPRRDAKSITVYLVYMELPKTVWRWLGGSRYEFLEHCHWNCSIFWSDALCYSSFSCVPSRWIVMFISGFIQSSHMKAEYPFPASSSIYIIHIPHFSKCYWFCLTPLYFSLPNHNYLFSPPSSLDENSS